MHYHVDTNFHFPHRHFPFTLLVSFPGAYITTELSMTLPSALLLYIHIIPISPAVDRGSCITMVSVVVDACMVVECRTVG